MTLRIGYLAEGRLYLKLSDSPAKEVTSQFVQRANEAAQKDADRHSWKSRPGEGPAMISSQMLWRTSNQRELTHFRITGVTQGSNQEILFALNTNSVGGLFAYDAGDGSERRLYHKQGFLGRHLARHPRKDLVALSIGGAQMEAHIALTDLEGRNLRQVTEGDSIDECPSWVVAEDKTLVFQSAGIGRNSQGIRTSIGPYRIERLDLIRGKMETLIENNRLDYLNPRVGSDGSLFFIRRPWSRHSRSTSFSTKVQDAFLFPFRLGRAIVHFFNFFSITFSGKPLLTSGGPPQPMDTTSMLLWGKVIDAEKALKNMNPDLTTALVPASWELVCHPPTGEPQVLATSVGAFDLGPDGSVVHTNGSAIYILGRDGSQETVCTHKLIEGLTCWSED
jgi:hypothetical protein